MIVRIRRYFNIFYGCNGWNKTPLQRYSYFFFNWKFKFCLLRSRNRQVERAKQKSEATKEISNENTHSRQYQATRRAANTSRVSARFMLKNAVLYLQKCLTNTKPRHFSFDIASLYHNSLSVKYLSNLCIYINTIITFVHL